MLHMRAQMKQIALDNHLNIDSSLSSVHMHK